MPYIYTVCTLHFNYVHICLYTACLIFRFTQAHCILCLYAHVIFTHIILCIRVYLYSAPISWLWAVYLQYCLEQTIFYFIFHCVFVVHIVFSICCVYIQSLTPRSSFCSANCKKSPSQYYFIQWSGDYKLNGFTASIQIALALEPSTAGKHWESFIIPLSTKTSRHSLQCFRWNLNYVNYFCYWSDCVVHCNHCSLFVLFIYSVFSCTPPAWHYSLL